MNRRKHILAFTAGDTTCYDGKRLCPEVFTRRLGQEWVCRRFPEGDEPNTRLWRENEEGYLLRCKACLDAEVK